MDIQVISDAQSLLTRTLSLATHHGTVMSNQEKEQLKQLALKLYRFISMGCASRNDEISSQLDVVDAQLRVIEPMLRRRGADKRSSSVSAFKTSPSTEGEVAMDSLLSAIRELDVPAILALPGAEREEVITGVEAKIDQLCNELHEDQRMRIERLFA